MASNAGEQQRKGKGKKGRPLSGNESVAAMVDGSAPAKGKGKAPHRVVSPGTTKGNELPSPGKGESKATQPLSKGTGDQSSLAGKGVSAKGKTKATALPPSCWNSLLECPATNRSTLLIR